MNRSWIKEANRCMAITGTKQCTAFGRMIEGDRLCKNHKNHKNHGTNHHPFTSLAEFFTINDLTPEELAALATPLKQGMGVPDKRRRKEPKDPSITLSE